MGVGRDAPVQNPGEYQARSRDCTLVISTSINGCTYILVNDKATRKDAMEVFCQRRLSRTRRAAIDPTTITYMETPTCREGLSGAREVARQAMQF
jgi:hypothetical protein